MSCHLQLTHNVGWINFTVLAVLIMKDFIREKYEFVCLRTIYKLLQFLTVFCYAQHRE